MQPASSTPDSTAAPRGRAARLALALLFLALVAAAAYTSSQIVERQAAIRWASQSDVAARTGQAMSALSALERDIAVAALDGENAGSDQVKPALDAATDRVARLQAPDMAGAMAASPRLSATARRLAAALAQVRLWSETLARPGADPSARRAAASAMLAVLTPLDAALSQDAMAATGVVTVGLDQDQRSLGLLHWLFAALLLALLGGGVLLMALLARSRHALQQASVEARGLAAGLRRTGADLVAANEAVLAANRQLQYRNEMLRQRDEELFTQYHRFEAALDNMSQALCMAGRDGKLIVCNRRFLTMFHLSEAMAMPGLDIADVRRSILQSRAYPPDLMHDIFRQAGRAGRHAGARRVPGGLRRTHLGRRAPAYGGWRMGRHL